MKKEDMLQTLSFLALKMENSGTQLLEAIAPKSLIHLDPALTRDNRRYNPNSTSELSSLEVNDIVKRVKRVGDFLNITPVQASLMVAAFSRKFQDNLIDWDDIRQFFEVKSMVLLPLKKDFDQLVTDKYLLPSGRRNCYEIANCVIESVMNEKKFNPQELNDPNYDRYKFVHEISDLIEQRRDDQFMTQILFEKAHNLEQRHADITFVQQVQKLNMGIEERVLFYEICDDFVGGGESGMNCTLKDIYEFPSTRFRIAKDLMDENHTLQNRDLIELLPERMLSDSSITLSEKGKHLFLEEDYELFADTKKRNQNLLYPDQIPEKQLFYDAELERQLRLFARTWKTRNSWNCRNVWRKSPCPRG